MSTWLSDRRTLIVVAVLAILGASIAVVQLSAAAFTATTQTGENSWESGTVTITSDRDGQVDVALTGMKPGDSTESCVVVTYAGDLDATVGMYVTPGATQDLATYLDVTVERAADDLTDGGDCAEFTGGTEVYAGTLSGMVTDHHDWSSGSALGWSASAADAVRTYLIRVELPSDVDDAAQGKSAEAAFVWEARNT